MKNWEHIKQYLAVLGVNAGLTRNRYALLLLARLWPEFADLMVALEELYLPRNSILWYFAEGDQDVEGVFELVDQNIDRAATPLGNDNFVIVVERYSALPEERKLDLDQQDDLDWLDNSIPMRKLVHRGDLHGNRWKDWKRGNAKEQARELLRNAAPAAQYPLTIVRAAVLGHANERLYWQFFAENKKEGG